MKLFHLYRWEDVSGISGTGPVVEGVEFSNGWCALRWMSSTSTICFYQSLEDVKSIHSHGSRTELVIHDFHVTKQATQDMRFEGFLELIEAVSEVVTRSEDPGRTDEEVKSALQDVRTLVDKLETVVMKRKRPAA